MEVLEIVQSAAFKSGLVSSFNPDELPGDIQDAGRTILQNEILPMLNCDRTLDITVTSRVYKPNGGRIILTPYSQPRENEKLLGYSKYTSAELKADPTKFFGEAVRLNQFFNDTNWPTDDFGNPIIASMWGSDIILVSGYTNGVTDVVVVHDDINIDFPPMRVESVLDEGSRIKYEYLYREEFERILKTAIPCVYTTEEYSDKIVVIINGTSDLKRLILPVPLQIINVTHDYQGTIIAPPKFKRYLIDATAVSLAIVYGLSTVQSMQQQAAQSYQMLKKNKPQPMHKASPSEEINDVLRHNVGGRKFYAGF